MNPTQNSVILKAGWGENQITALLLGLVAVCTIVVLAKHPVVSPGASAEQSLAQIVALQSMDQWVHGILIAMVGVLAHTLTRFSEVIGTQSAFARVARGAYLTGCVSVIAAMLLDGFIIPKLAIRYVDSVDTPLQIAMGLLGFCSVVIQLLTKFGFVLMSIAFIAWAIALHGLRTQLPGASWAWATAAVAGAAPATYLLVSPSALTPHSLMAIVSVQTIGYLTIAQLMWSMKK